jgi:hypothetical protein
MNNEWGTGNDEKLQVSNEMFPKNIVQDCWHQITSGLPVLQVRPSMKVITNV